MGQTKDINLIEKATKEAYEENKKFTYFAFFIGLGLGFMYAMLLFK